MAARNEANIRFRAETSEFTEAIKEADSEMRTLRAEMRLNEAQFQNTGNETEYLQQKAQLLEAQLSANADKQQNLTDKIETAKQYYGENSEEVAKLERSLINTQTEEQKLINDLNNTNAALDGQTEAAENAASSVDTMSEILVNAGIASAVKDIGQAALEMAGDFDEASASIVEGTGASGEALESLNESAQRAFGRIADADQDIDGVANILAELNTRFGVTGTEAEDLTVKIANFAQHTGTDGTKAVDNIANVMNRWNMDISESGALLDDLTTANQSCQLSSDELTNYLSENSIQFKELGYSTEDALAMLISLSDGGANVSSVMSGMKKAVGNLSEVTDDVPGAFQNAITAIAECDNVSEALQAQVGDTGKTVEEIFGAKAAQELAANVQSGNFAIDEWTKVLQENDGALESTTENATTMGDAWHQAVNNVSMALGGTLTPAISDTVIKISDAISKFSQWVQQSPGMQAAITGIAVALGILGAALAISAAISAVQKAFAMLNTTLLMNPIFLVITGIVAFVAALVYAYQHCETFRNIVSSVFNFIKNGIIGHLTSIKATIQNVFSAIKTIFDTVWNAVKSVTVTVWNSIKSKITTVLSTIKTVVTTVFVGIKSVATTTWNAIKNAITHPVQTAKNTVTGIFNAIKSVITGVVNGIKSTVTNVFNGIKSAMTHPIETAKSTISNILSKIKGFFPLSIGKIFSNLQIPHISVSGGKAPYGIAGKGTLPHFSVSWRAKGAVFSAPTLIPSINGAINGVGEAGPEAVSPISVLRDYVGSAVEQHVPRIDYDLLGERVAVACAKMNIGIALNGREVGRILREYA